jgi:hypothetical protein
VEVDYLNLLLLTKGRNTIESCFDANGEACIQPNALRIHGKFTESIDWDDVKQRFAITDRQVLELKKDRSTGNVVWHNDYKNVDLRQFAFFATVVEPTNGFDSKRLSWRLGPQNAFSNFTLDRTGHTNYDFKSMFNLKLTLQPQRTMFDPNGKYSMTNTVNYLRQVDLDTQEQAAKSCSTIVTEYNRLHKNSDVMFKDYVALARAGDQVLQQGAISPPHTNVLHAFCNTPHFSTSVYASKCPCSGWLRLRHRPQPCCGSWQGRFAKHRSVP